MATISQIASIKEDLIISQNTKDDNCINSTRGKFSWNASSLISNNLFEQSWLHKAFLQMYFEIKIWHGNWTREEGLNNNQMQLFSRIRRSWSRLSTATRFFPAGKLKRKSRLKKRRRTLLADTLSINHTGRKFGHDWWAGLFILNWRVFLRLVWRGV